MKVLVLILLVLLPFFGSAQRDVELILPGTIQIGASVASVDRNSASMWTQSVGNSISVVLNGHYVLTNYRLTMYKKKLKVRLNKGSNQLIVLAHNEGTIPPNTAQCKMFFGRKKWDFAVSCGLKSNAGIEILVDP